MQYSLPEKGFEILNELGFSKFQNILDLGCGTGLSGIKLRECCEKLIGVDLSKKMLAQAHAKHIYDDLVEVDIISFLREDLQHYDLIQALDVLPYLGELDELFNALVPRLNEKGVFLFSAEISENQPWKIQDSMRFCHDPDYIQSLLKSYGLKELYCSRVIARQENEQPLYATLFMYQKVDETGL